MEDKDFYQADVKSLAINVLHVLSVSPIDKVLNNLCQNFSEKGVA